MSDQSTLFADGLAVASYGLLHSLLQERMSAVELDVLRPMLASGRLTASTTATWVGDAVAIVVTLRGTGGEAIQRFTLEPKRFTDTSVPESAIPPDTPVAKLGRLYEELRDAGPADGISPSSREYLLRGIETAVRRDESIHSALGLSRQGRDGSLQGQLQLLKRNQHLLAALESMSFDAAVTMHARCRRLGRHVARFMDHEWQQARRRADPAPDWPAWKAEIFRAAQTDKPMPRSASALMEIVRNTPPFSPNTVAATVLANLL